MIKTFLDPLTPISPDDWSELSKKQQWDVKVALRGPDLANTNLKIYTTAIIRWVCSSAMRTGGAINSFCPVLMLPKDLYQLRRGEDTRWGFDLYHFMVHIQEAAMVLEIPSVEMTRLAWEEAFGNNVSTKDFYTLLLDDLGQTYLSNKKPMVVESLWAVLESRKKVDRANRELDQYIDKGDEDNDDDE